MVVKQLWYCIVTQIYLVFSYWFELQYIWLKFAVIQCYKISFRVVLIISSCFPTRYTCWVCDNIAPSYWIIIYSISSQQTEDAGSHPNCEFDEFGNCMEVGKRPFYRHSMFVLNFTIFMSTKFFIFYRCIFWFMLVLQTIFNKIPTLHRKLEWVPDQILLE